MPMKTKAARQPHAAAIGCFAMSASGSAQPVGAFGFGSRQGSELAQARNAPGRQGQQERRSPGEGQRPAQAQVLAQPAADQRAGPGRQQGQPAHGAGHAAQQRLGRDRLPQPVGAGAGGAGAFRVSRRDAGNAEAMPASPSAAGNPTPARSGSAVSISTSAASCFRATTTASRRIALSQFGSNWFRRFIATSPRVSHDSSAHRDR